MLMKTVASSLHHCVVPPSQQLSAQHPTLILLHGRGANEEDLLSLAPAFDERLLIIAPRAPVPFSYGGYTWFDIDEAGIPQSPQFEESCAKLDVFVADVLRSYPVDPARLLLFGFSMGAVMSCVMALTHPELYRGIALNSGYLPEHTSLKYRWNDIGNLNVSITHGTDDPIIPVEAARRAHQRFSASPAKVTYKEYAMGHEISQQSLADVTRWITGLL